MPADFLGNEISGGSDATIAGIDDFVGGMLAYESRAEHILDAAARSPGHCLANVYAGMLRMLAEAPSAPAGAGPYLAAARAASRDATARERRLVDMLAAWVSGDVKHAVELLDGIVMDHPRDLLSLKMLHYHLFNRGDFPAMLRAALHALEAAPEVAYTHGMAAFGYEQCHLLDHAEVASRKALEISEREPWAQHALAHVMLTQGRIDEGVRFLEGVRPLWTGLNSFMVTHLWWHLALFYLSQGREPDALAAYDAQVWAVAKDYSQDQIGAVSLLARLEMADVDVGDRWRELGGYLAVRADDVVQPFLSVQYLYGLARAKLPEAEQLLAAIGAVAETQGEAWTLAAVPLAEGLFAHAAGDFARAARRIGEALPHTIRMGGSHAQRDLFEQLMLDAVIRSGDLAEAQQMLELRRAHDPEGVPLNRQLGSIYRRLGLPSLAAEADARVAQRLAA